MRALMTRKSCAVEMRNAILRNYLKKSLAIKKEIGDRSVGEASCYGNLAGFYAAVGDNDKANQHFEKSLTISRKNGDKEGVMVCCSNLAALLHRLRKYSKANTYNREALSIASEIRHRAGKARSLLTQGAILLGIGDCVKAKKYFEEAVTISKEIGNRPTEANCCFLLGEVLFQEGKNVNAEKQFGMSLAISEDTGHVFEQYKSLVALARLRLKDKRRKEATSYLQMAIEKYEKMRGCLPNNDQWKILFSGTEISSYRTLCILLLECGNPEPALYVSELGKARALADLMSAKYSVKNQVSANPQTWTVWNCGKHHGQRT